MKRIEAMIKTVDLDRLTDRLNTIGIHGMTISEIKCFGMKAEYAIVFNAVDFVPKLKIEIIASDNNVEEVIEIIVNNANTNMEGETKIFVSCIEDVIRIRTGEKGDEAIK